MAKKEAASIVTSNNNLTVEKCFKLEKFTPNRTEKIDNKKVSVEYTKLTFNKYQTIYEIEGKQQRSHKKVLRSRPDTWRRYGAQRQIHEIGGYVIQFQPTASGTRKTRRTVYVKPKTPMPPEPKEKPIMTQEEFYLRPVVMGAASNTSTSLKDDPCDNTNASDTLSENEVVKATSTTPKSQKEKSEKGSGSWV